MKHKISFIIRQMSVDSEFWRSHKRLCITLVNRDDDSRAVIISHRNIPASRNVRLWNEILLALLVIFHST